VQLEDFAMDPGNLWPMITVVGVLILGGGLAYGMMQTKRYRRDGTLAGAPRADAGRADLPARRQIMVAMPIALAALVLVIGVVVGVSYFVGQDEGPANVAAVDNLAGAVTTGELERSVTTDAPPTGSGPEPGSYRAAAQQPAAERRAGEG
jgi:hypothetical protein